METFRKILVPTDFSAHAQRAIEVAGELSRAYRAPVTVLHVYDPVSYPLPDGYLMYTPGQLSDMWGEFERRLAQAERDAVAAGACAVEGRLLEGLTANEITAFASAHGHDLIVMGTHGRRALQRLLLGSVAARVVQTAPCSVLTVRAPECAEVPSSAAP
jgi:nucleotide-binding universal stress UspA family protein